MRSSSRAARTPPAPSRSLPVLADTGSRPSTSSSATALGAYAPAAWAAAVGAVVAAGSYDAVVAPASDRATEVLAQVAARTGQPMAANVVAASSPANGGGITRQRWAGSLLEDAGLDGAPRFSRSRRTLVPAAEPAAGGAAPRSRGSAPHVTDADLRARVVGRDVAAAARACRWPMPRSWSAAGAGWAAREAFAMLDELAALLGAAVGVSRVATSLGWRPHAQQIGQTGTRIAPDLYIACGISGAIQHIVGAKAAKRILVINTDPEAPIFRRASYAVIGDVHTVVPAITAEMRRAKGAG